MSNKQIIIYETDFQKARKVIKQNKGKRTVFTSNNDELNRQILEKENVDVLLINLIARKDRMKQRDSGFNQVLAKLAKKKDIAIGINVDEIIDTKINEKPIILSRIRQNIKICKKNKLKMEFISPSGKKLNSYDLKSLGLIIGMPTWMTKDIN